MAQGLMTIPLSQLRRSALNVRKTEPKRDLEELAASIAAHGLLQNLTVRPVGDNGRKKAEHYEVIAGGRRLAALKLLAKHKKIASNVPVPCQIVSLDAAGEVSLAENVVRTSLHPADQFEAFSKLQAEGLSVDEIAARFGVSTKTVQQRLKLAAVSPKLMAVYREGDLTLDQLTAFTLSDDHEAQERVWFDGNPYDRHPQALRRQLTSSLVSGGDRRARFVGAEAYKSAGGIILQDLFQSEEEGWFTDSQLLDRLTGELLRLEAEKIKAEGWAWVEVMTEVDYAYLSRFRRIPATDIPLSQEEEKLLSACCEQHDALVTTLADDAPETVTAELDRLCTEIERLSARKEQWRDEDKAQAGAVISLDYHGKFCVTRGLAARKTGEPTSGARIDRTNDSETETQASKPGNAVSDRLLEDLTAHRTAALRATLAGSPGTALRALSHLLVLRTFFDFTGEGCIDIRSHVADLRSWADGIAESKAMAELGARHAALLERLPDPAGLWAWLGEQDDTVVLEYLAYCVANTVNAVRRKGDRPDSPRFVHADGIADAVSLDMSAWWEPTGERYLARVSKAAIVDAVSEAVSPQAAENIATMKKDAMVAQAERLLGGKAWLPEVLRPVKVMCAETA